MYLSSHPDLLHPKPYQYPSYQTSSFICQPITCFSSHPDLLHPIPLILKLFLDSPTPLLNLQELCHCSAMISSRASRRTMRRRSLRCGSACWRSTMRWCMTCSVQPRTRMASRSANTPRKGSTVSVLCCALVNAAAWNLEQYHQHHPCYQSLLVQDSRGKVPKSEHDRDER